MIIDDSVLKDPYFEMDLYPNTRRLREEILAEREKKLAEKEKDYLGKILKT